LGGDECSNLIERESEGDDVRDEKREWERVVRCEGGGENGEKRLHRGARAEGTAAEVGEGDVLTF
jgi:hypothetical protein